MPSKLLDLTGKVVLVTGGTRGIGKAAASLLAQYGATVIITGVSDPCAVDGGVEELVRISPAGHMGAKVDVTKPDEVKNLFLKIGRDFKRLDVLVNNAGAMLTALISMTGPEQMQRLNDININGTLYNIHYGSRLMMRKQSGSIINVGSVVGTFGSAGQIVYSGTKSAMVGISKSAAKELGPHNIRVNCIAPGFIDTDLIRDFDGEERKAVVSRIGLNRIGSPDDVARVILFLASDISAYVSGQVIGVDGCMSL